MINETDRQAEGEDYARNGTRHDICSLEASGQNETGYPAPIYLMVPTSASLMKSAWRRTAATPRTPHPPKNKRALALKTTNLMKLFIYPMVSCEEIPRHKPIGPMRPKQ